MCNINTFEALRVIVVVVLSPEKALPKCSNQAPQLEKKETRKRSGDDASVLL